MTHAAFPKLLGIDGRGEVESPRVVGGRVLPIDEALRSLADASACKKRGQTSNVALHLGAKVAVDGYYIQKGK